MKYQDYYATLGVPRTASQEQIQREYRKLARKYHPDVNKAKGAEDRFKQINEAYEVLGDAEKRKRFDALGANWRDGQDFRPPPGFDFGTFGKGGPFGFGNTAEFSGRMSDSGLGGFSDFFEAVFGGGFGVDPRFAAGEGRHFTHSGRGTDLEVQVSLSLDDIFRNATKSIGLETLEQDANGYPKRRVRHFDVRIPPGTTDGSLIRLAGQAGNGGDILLRVKIAPHPIFKVQGYDLHMQIPITPWEAALGEKISVRALDQEIKVQVPPAAKTGQKLRLRGLGLNLAKGGRGDLYAELKITVPEKLSAKEKELFEELRKVSKFNPR